MYSHRLALVPAFVAMALITAPLSAHAQAPAKAAAKPALTVSTVQPQKDTWPEIVSIAGEVAAWQESIIGSEIEQQRILEVLVNVGDTVRKGQLLARTTDDAARADVAQAEAALAEADALLLEARANADKAQRLREKGFYSPQQGTQYETAQAATQARQKAAAAVLQAARVRLGKTRITAPDAGVISARKATVGSLTGIGDELFRLIRQGRLEWRAEVPEGYLHHVRAGMPAQIATISGARITGKVRTVSPSIDARTRNALVYVDLPAEQTVRAGMFVRGDIELGRAENLTIPQSALVLRDGFAYVLDTPKVSAGETAIVKQIKVEIGRRLGERVAVRSGLRPDMNLVASGVGFLADGDTVRVENSAKPSPNPSAASSK
jgi:HlyD family secretion protein